MNENKNVPELRFPGFEGEWGLRFIGSVLTIGSGKDYKHLGVGDVPVYGTGGYMLSVNDYLYDGKSVCIGRKGTIDKPKFVEGKFWTVDTLFYTHSYKNSVPEFVYGVFQKINWQKYNEASGVPSLSKTTIEKIKIYLPVVEEQQKIADFLSAVDKKIEQLTEKHRLLTQYKKGVMQQVFSQQIRFKDDEGKEYPEWEEKRLGELGKTYNGLTGKSSEDFGEGFPFITYKQIFDSNRIGTDKFGLVKVIDGEKQNQAKYGDVFFTTSSETPGEVGYASVLLDNVENLYLNSFCFGYRVVSEQILKPEFARWLFGSEDFRKNVVKLAQGSTRYNMSKVELMKLRVFLPCIKEQQKIADFLTAIDNKIDQAWSKLEQTKAFKKGLLQKMFV